MFEHGKETFLREFNYDEFRTVHLVLDESIAAASETANSDKSK